jgi:Flp pilus assembly protein TadG
MDDATKGAQRGAAAILVAALLIGLMGIAAIALDGSNAYRTRSDTQRAADAAALSAAWEDCTGTGDPVAVGLAAAAVNGYPTGVSVSHEGDDWVVTVDETIDAPFGQAIGRDTLSVQTQAVARCELTPADQYALFTGGTHCNNSLALTGSSSEVTGNVHSNSDIQISGSSNTIYGNGSALGTAPGPPQVNWVPAAGNPEAVAVPLDYPVIYSASSFAPGGPKAIEAGSDFHDFFGADIDIAALTDAGLWDAVTSTITTGLYYTTGSVSLSASSLSGTVTFVTDPAPGTNDGTITMSGSGHTLTPYDSSGLLMFSGHQKQIPLSRNANCTSDAVGLSGSGMDWTGIIYAPGGRVRMSSASNSSLNGSIISLSTDLSGSSLSLVYDSDLGEDVPRIGLRE